MGGGIKWDADAIDGDQLLKVFATDEPLDTLVNYGQVRKLNRTVAILEFTPPPIWLTCLWGKSPM